MKATVYIQFKEGVLDPQGKAVNKGLHNLGFTAVKDVRIGKLVEVFLDDMPKEEAAALVGQMCEKLLANTVIEKYEYDIKS